MNYPMSFKGYDFDLENSVFFRNFLDVCVLKFNRLDQHFLLLRLSAENSSHVKEMSFEQVLAIFCNLPQKWGKKEKKSRLLNTNSFEEYLSVYGILGFVFES
eukprot:Sdes_comp15943_c0_seq1m5090